MAIDYFDERCEINGISFLKNGTTFASRRRVTQNDMIVTEKDIL
jgi:hypothetical protein